MIFPKNKRREKDITWRDYWLLMLLILMWIIIVEIGLFYNPITFDVNIPYVGFVEVIFTLICVFLWIPIAYWIGKQKGFSRKWILICFVAGLVSIQMLTNTQQKGFFPLECSYLYEQIGDSIVWLRTRVECTRPFMLVIE